MGRLNLIKYLAIFLVAIGLCTIANFFCIELQLNSNDLPYKEPLVTNIEYEIVRPSNINYETLKDEVDKLFGNPNYTLKISELDGTLRGECKIFSKEITLDNDLNFEYFTFCLAHELVHLTEFNLNERYANLTTFKKLYSSGNDYFKNVALYFADLDLRGAFSQEYSFVGYIKV